LFRENSLAGLLVEHFGQCFIVKVCLLGKFCQQVERESSVKVTKTPPTCLQLYANKQRESDKTAGILSMEQALRGGRRRAENPLGGSI
jgi:hypothetical protein